MKKIVLITLLFLGSFQAYTIEKLFMEMGLVSTTVAFIAISYNERQSEKRLTFESKMYSFLFAGAALFQMGVILYIHKKLPE